MPNQRHPQQTHKNIADIAKSLSCALGADKKSFGPQRAAMLQEIAAVRGVGGGDLVSRVKIFKLTIHKSAACVAFHKPRGAAHAIVKFDANSRDVLS